MTYRPNVLTIRLGSDLFVTYQLDDDPTCIQPLVICRLVQPESDLFMTYRPVCRLNDLLTYTDLSCILTTCCFQCGLKLDSCVNIFYFLLYLVQYRKFSLYNVKDLDWYCIKNFIFIDFLIWGKLNICIVTFLAMKGNN